MNRIERWIADSPTWLAVSTITTAVALVACAVAIPIGLWLTTIL